MAQTVFARLETKDHAEAAKTYRTASDGGPSR